MVFILDMHDTVGRKYVTMDLLDIVNINMNNVEVVVMNDMAGYHRHQGHGGHIKSCRPGQHVSSSIICLLSTPQLNYNLTSTEL